MYIYIGEYGKIEIAAAAIFITGIYPVKCVWPRLKTKSRELVCPSHSGHRGIAV